MKLTPVRVFSCKHTLWCSGQGVACTCGKTGFDSRRRCFLFLFTVFFLFLFGPCFLTLLFLLACFPLFLLLTLLIVHLDQYIFYV